MDSNVPAGQAAAPVAMAPDSKHANIEGPPAHAPANQSSTSSALANSLDGTSRMHQPPREVGQEGTVPSAGVPRSNIDPSANTTDIPPGQGPKHAPISGAPATNPPAQSSTASALTDSLVGSSRLHEKPHGAGTESAAMGGVTLGNIAPASNLDPGKGSKDIPRGGPPATAAPAQSSTAAALQSAMGGTERMHQPPRQG